MLTPRCPEGGTEVVHKWKDDYGDYVAIYWALRDPNGNITVRPTEFIPWLITHLQEPGVREQIIREAAEKRMGI